MFDTLSPPPHLRNLKWEPLAQSGAITTRVSSYKTKEIAVVANNFQRNIQRIKWMILVPSAVGDMTIRIQRCFDVAEFMITKTLDTTGADLSNRDEITALAQRLFHNSSQEELNKIGTAEWEDFIQIALERGTRPVLMIAAPLTPARNGLEAILSFCVTGTWTAFETMAGDLWEAALNVHPSGLSELKGKRKSGQKPSDVNETPDLRGDDSAESASLKMVPLAELIRHEYEIRGKMGSVPRARQRFDHLAGIREAYRLAFFKNFEQVDAALTDDVIDALNAVRNLIVHRAGVVDETYEKRSRHLDIPKAPIGQPIFLDGEIVAKLMESVISSSLHLLVAVDEWIAAE